MAAFSGILPAVGFCQFTANRAHKDILRMPGIGGKEISGEQVYIFSAFPAFFDFYPKKVFYVRIFRATGQATGPVEMSDLFFKCRSQ